MRRSARPPPEPGPADGLDRPTTTAASAGGAPCPGSHHPSHFFGARWACASRSSSHRADRAPRRGGNVQDRDRHRLHDHRAVRARSRHLHRPIHPRGQGDRRGRRADLRRRGRAGACRPQLYRVEAVLHRVRPRHLDRRRGTRRHRLDGEVHQEEAADDAADQDGHRQRIGHQFVADVSAEPPASTPTSSAAATGA